MVSADWRLSGSVGRAPRAGTVWLGLELHQVDATLDTTVLKVRECNRKDNIFKILVATILNEHTIMM